MVCYLLFFVLQSADGVENRDNHDTDIRKDGCPHVRKTERGERETAELDDEREHDVLLDDADALTGNFDGLCNLHRVIVHEDNVCGFDGGIAAHGAHGDADIGTGEHRRIVDAVADEREVCFLRLILNELFDFVDLIAREQLAANFVDTKLFGDLISHTLGIACEHDGFFNTGVLQLLNGFLGMGLDDIGDNDVTGIFAVD